jgi:hypothetical protein
MYVMASLLVVGSICIAFIRPATALVGARRLGFPFERLLQARISVLYA